ncbi:MAG TPA: hypothetical protein VEQ63_04530 [Bryobacteraceae bacterium]|nr:hypothetical protein [Bryobacteraceae bacterium]
MGNTPMSGYPMLRTVHLVCGAFAAPMLLMYGVSAVQMAHAKWFRIEPSVSEVRMTVTSTYTDGRRLAREVMEHQGLRGEIKWVQSTPAGFSAQVGVPGTVHEIRWDRTSGTVVVKTSVSGLLGILNRLHHTAGFWHDYVPLKIWAALVGLVSAATVGLAATGVWMWWARKQERVSGLVLLGLNLAVSLGLLVWLRFAGR